MVDAAEQRRLSVSGLLALVVAVVGLAASTYLTVEHYRSVTTFACPETGAVNCAKVTTSSWSHVLGLPVADLGLAFYLVVLVLVVPPAWNRRAFALPRVAVLSAGMVFVLYLLWAELFRIDAICLYCTAVHVCTAVLLGLSLWRWATDL